MVPGDKCEPSRLGFNAADKVAPGATHGLGRLRILIAATGEGNRPLKGMPAVTRDIERKRGPTAELAARSNGLKIGLGKGLTRR